MTHALLRPLTFRNGQSAPNRLWLAPMTNQSSHEDGRLSDDERGFLVARAAGGFGVIETCATHVTQAGQGWRRELGIFSDDMIPGWRRLAQEVEAHGSLLIGQCFHGGAKALRTPERPDPWSCSASQAGEPVVTAATEQRIEATIQAFVDAALRLEAAGAHGLELHGAHGYLLCQFLSSVLNRRRDQWGGSLENRARLLRRTLQSCRAAVGQDFIVGVRLSPESYASLPGLDLDESLQVAAWLCEDGADFIHLSLWDASALSKKRPKQHPARIFRDALPREVPIITAGKVWTEAEALAQLDHGADAVALGRAAIVNPEWPTVVVQQRGQPRRTPVTAQILRDCALGPAFIEYMRRWQGFVSD